MAGLRLGALRRYLDDELFVGALGLLSADEAAIVEISLPEIDTQGFGTLLGREMVKTWLSISGITHLRWS